MRTLHTKSVIITAAFGIMMAACSQIPKEAYYTHGQPESLVDSSSEVVNMRIESPASVEEITNMIDRDQPSRAQLSCSPGEGLCGEVQSVLRQFGVPVKYTPASDNSVALIYERLQTRDCENRYIDNSVNPYNLNHPTYGCTVAVNMAQMITDKRELVSPALMDYADGTKVGQAIGFYNTQSNYTPPSVDPNFQPVATEATVSSSSGSR